MVIFTFVPSTVQTCPRHSILEFLSQARAGQRPARDWFLEIAFVRDVSIFVCASAPEAINN